jgi:hypothetical protein
LTKHCGMQLQKQNKKMVEATASLCKMFCFVNLVVSSDTWE